MKPHHLRLFVLMILAVFVLMGSPASHALAPTPDHLAMHATGETNGPNPHLVSIVCCVFASLPRAPQLAFLHLGQRTSWQLPAPTPLLGLDSVPDPRPPRA